jgi:hypothetical protein
MIKGPVVEDPIPRSFELAMEGGIRNQYNS